VPVFNLKARNIFVPIAAVHRFCCCCLSVHRYWHKQPSRSCPQVLLLLSVSTQILTQTAITVSLLSSQLINQTLTTFTL